ncbi:MAG: N-acetyltransferase [Saprospiraceae bacterium]|nr:N-acetyltransferase [Saprospiraceae bacterium]MCB9320039.1 N-acetyltransferase [Lewinellaceae bacterium]
MNLSFLIRPATEADSAPMLAIYRPYIEVGYVSFEEVVPDLDEFDRRRMHYQASAPWLVVTFEHKVIGYAYAAAHRGRPAYRWTRELSIYLDTDHHRRGVAQALYFALIQVLQWQGYVNVLAGVTLPNPASERFHEKLGMTPVGTYHHIGYKFGTYCDVRWYELFIGELHTPPAEIRSLEGFWQSREWEVICSEALAKVGS